MEHGVQSVNQVASLTTDAPEIPKNPVDKKSPDKGQQQPQPAPAPLQSAASAIGRHLLQVVGGGYVPTFGT